MIIRYLDPWGKAQVDVNPPVFYGLIRAYGCPVVHPKGPCTHIAYTVGPLYLFWGVP